MSEVNPYVREAHCHKVASMIDHECSGSLTIFLMYMVCAYGWMPDVDKRTKEGKRMVIAHKALMDAAHEYDAARRGMKGEQS